MLPKITAFSDGYYLVSNIYIEPSAEPSPALEENFYAFLQDEVYEEQSTPIMMKHSKRHFEVEPRSGVPIDVLEVPASEIDDWDVENPPSREQVLLAKPETAHRMGQALFFDHPTDEDLFEDDFR